MLRVRLLGGLRLEAGGCAIDPPPGTPARALLAWLALHPGMHTRSRVAAALWPDVLDESARLSLRTALFALRDALGQEAEAVKATREQIGLAPDVSVDVRELDELMAAGRLEQAIELHRGDLVPELGHDWVLEARDERRALLAEAIARVANAAEERGELGLAIRRSRELVALDPLSEEAHRALIHRLAATGDRGAALAAFEKLRERLGRELEIAPAPETRDLVERVRRAVPKPRLVAAPAALPPVLARRHRSDFVGRRTELGRLRESWKLARGGERQLVVVFGEPGVGKSRLAAQLAKLVHEEGSAVLFGRCSEEPLLPYQPFVEALRPYLPSGSAGTIGELARLVPGLADQAEGAARAAEEPEAARFRLFEAVAALLAELSEEQPLVMVVEDIHWADKPTMRLLSHLVGAPEPARLLVLVTYRQTELRWADPLAAALAELRRERLGTRVRLGGLDAEDVAELVSAWIGPEAPSALPSEIHRRTGGNPFFIEEVLSHLMQAGVGIEAAGVPEGVKEVVGGRLRNLEEDTQCTLGAASVLGRRFDLHLLETMVEELSTAQIADALDEAVGAGLIREEPERAGRFAFSHALVREALYEGVAGGRRSALHARAGAALERLYGERPERVAEIAHHLLEAAAPSLADRAVDYAARAADLALDQLAYEDAALQLERALRALELVGPANDERRCELLIALGDARSRAGDRSGGRAAFGPAARVARALGREDLLARAALGFGGLGVTILEVDEATVALLEEALAALEASDPLRARLLARLGVELYYGPTRERSEALGAEAVEAARRAGDELSLAYALNALHVSLWRADRLGERLALAREMVALAERTGDREGELQGRNWLCTDLFEAGEIAELDAAIEHYCELAKQLRLPAFEWYAPLWRGALAALRGQFAEAELRLREAVRLGTHGGDRNVALADQVRLLIDCMRGDFEAIYQRFLPMAEPKLGSSPASLSFRCGLTFCAAGSERGAEAREHLEQLTRHGLDRMPFDVNWLETIACLGEACAMLGDTDRTAELYELLLPYRGRIAVVAGRALASWGVVDRHLGVMAAANSRFDDAQTHFEAALRSNERLGFRPWAAWTRYQHAQMLLARDELGDRDRAIDLLVAARELASELGLDGLKRHVDTLSEAVAQRGASEPTRTQPK